MKKILSLLLVSLVAITLYGQSQVNLTQEITPASLVKIPTGEGNNSNNPNYMRPKLIDDLVILVSKDENREFSFTNKRSAYWYGRTHQDHFGAYFAGWNISTRRVLSDYSLLVDGQLLLRTETDNTTVTPDGITRQWPQAREQMRLIDNDDLIVIFVDAPKAKNISISFDQRLIIKTKGSKESLCLYPEQTPELMIKAVPIKPVDIQT